jgi:hypothetical protein
MTELLRDRGAPNFEDEPEALESPEWAAWSAAAYWDQGNFNELADIGMFDPISNTINTGRRDRTANGTEDRKRRHMLAKQALAGEAAPKTEAHPWPFPPGTDEPDIQIESTPAGEADVTEGKPMLPSIIGALLPSLIEAVPKLGKLFAGSKVAERNTKAAELALQVAQEALGARNAQEAVERVKEDPAAAATVTKAVEARWLELQEAGGDGISGARKADLERSGGEVLKSPSFWIAIALMPLVYAIVGAVVGFWGKDFSDEVRSAIANGVIGMVLGALVGYYFGQTTSRNRTPA